LHLSVGGAQSDDWAERIPLEPDPGNTGVGKRTKALHSR
jgi:hypothetical protein